MRKYALFGIFTLFFPVLVFAAGFAKQSLFLSKSPVTEGDTVSIYAVVANDAASKFTGKVVFSDGDAEVGSVAVSMNSGGAQTTSVSWKPTAGSHTITAKLVATDGTTAESESSTFSIKEKPKPASGISTTTVATTTVESSEGIQQSIENFNPTVGGITKPLFSTLDGLRQTMAGGLVAGVEWAKKVSTPTDTTDTGFVGTAQAMAGSVLFWFFSALLYMVANPALFYPIFAFVFFYLLWRLYKRMRRPSFEPM